MTCPSPNSKNYQGLSSANRAACNIKRIRASTTHKSIFSGGACPPPSSKNYQGLSSANRAACNIKRIQSSTVHKSIFSGGRGTRRARSKRAATRKSHARR